MNRLIGDIGVFNNNPALLGVSSVLEEVEIATTHLVFDRHRIEANKGFEPGSVWSIYDHFSGRMELAERAFRLSDFQAPEGYRPELGLDSRRYLAEAGKSLSLETYPDGQISAVSYFEKAELVKKEVYDDGGILAAVETYEPGERVIAELYGTYKISFVGAFRRIASILYLPENLTFDSQEAFWLWAFEGLVEQKKPEDKLFVLHEDFRRAVRLAKFERKNIYLLATEFLENKPDEDLFFDHYEKVVFNVSPDMAAVEKKFAQKTQAKLYWNNFIPAEHLERDFSSARQLYFYIGWESELVHFERLAELLNQLLAFDAELVLVLHVLSRQAHDYFSEKLSDLGRVRLMIRPFPAPMRENVKKSEFFIYYQNPEAVSSFALTDAIGLGIPILALAGNAMLSDFVQAENGKMVHPSQFLELIKRSLTIPHFYAALASNPSHMQAKLSPEATQKRWQAIFADGEDKR